MKFNKVEISAFRIYDDPKDGTFDFTTKAGETANFVSLYAPNGSGKTSFYDAVEWGMTDNIGRLLFKKNKDLADSQFEENKLSIIRNNYSELDTYVYITDDQGKTHSQELIINNRRKFDIEFNNKAVHPFHRVVLSQEWISAFLKEDDGHLRYDKFIKNPELIELDAYYKNLIGLINVVNKDKIEELKRKINKLKDRITETEESDLLNKINNSIVALMNFEEKLQEIKFSTTKEEVIAFRNLIAPKLISLEEELISNKELRESYKIAQNGNEDYFSLDLYYSKKKQIKHVGESIKEINLNIQKFKTLSELVNQKRGIDAKRELETKKKEDLEKITAAFKEYQQIGLQIRENATRKVKIENKLGIKQEKIRLYETTRISYDHKIRSLNLDISKINERLKNLPSLQKDIVNNNGNIERSERLVKLLKIRFKIRENKKHENEHLIGKYEEIIAKAEQYDYNLINKQHFVKTEFEDTYLDKIKLVRASLEGISGLKKQQEEITTQIDQQKKLSSDISDFIAKGLDLAKSIKKSSCPLCNHPHGSYEVLVQEISSNKLLDELLKKLLEEKRIIDNEIIGLKKTIDKTNAVIISIYRERISSLNDKTEQLNISEFLSKFESSEIKLQEFENTKLRLIDKLDNLSPEKLIATLNEKLLGLVGIKERVQYFDSKNKCLLDRRKEQIDLLNSRAELLKKEIDEFELSEQYKIVKDWFALNHPDVKIEQKNLDRLILDQKILISTYSTTIDKFADDIENLEKELNSYKKDELEIKHSQNQELIEKETIKVNSYQSFVKELINSSISETPREDVSKLLSEKDNELIEKEKKLNSIKSEYAKLEKFMEIVEPYLQSEQNKIELSVKEKELNIWENKVAPELNDERENVKKHLETKIKSFFHTDLINEIYKRIDPHPDFKNVEFKADFGSDNPRLDVFVTDKKLDRTLIPNLYFSTAQINILSLSIFLASALKSKEYDCILIDDPIQSMDSINVLSTIDLFRSIIVNQEKQIILSTHDENFHNLLKKKIPKNLFKSKFLELESFGKVKLDMN